MNMKIGKYEFDSKSAYETKLKALGTAILTKFS